MTLEDIIEKLLNENVNKINRLSIRRINVNRYVVLNKEVDKKISKEIFGKTEKRVRKKQEIRYIRKDEAEEEWEVRKQYWIYLSEEFVGNLCKNQIFNKIRVDLTPISEKTFEITPTYTTGHIVGNYWLSVDYSQAEKKNYRLTLPVHLCRELKSSEWDVKYVIIYKKENRYYLVGLCYMVYGGEYGRRFLSGVNHYSLV